MHMISRQWQPANFGMDGNGWRIGAARWNRTCGEVDVGAWKVPPSAIAQSESKSILVYLYLGFYLAFWREFVWFPTARALCSSLSGVRIPAMRATYYLKALNVLVPMYVLQLRSYITYIFNQYTVLDSSTLIETWNAYFCVQIKCQEADLEDIFDLICTSEVNCRAGHLLSSLAALAPRLWGLNWTKLQPCAWNDAMNSSQSQVAVINHWANIEGKNNRWNRLEGQLWTCWLRRSMCTGWHRSFEAI